MSDTTISKQLERIGNHRAMLAARFTNDGVTADNREELLELCKQIRDDNHTLGALLADAANGRGPDACSLTPLKLTGAVPGGGGGS